MGVPQDCPMCLGRWPRPDHQIGALGLLTAYLHDDQFFPGWTVLVFQRHATELFQLTRAERHDVMDHLSSMAHALAEVFQPVKVNYAMLGNQLPHMHWHIVPRLRDDPAPQEAIWGVRHQPMRLADDALSNRLSLIREKLG